MEGTPRVDAFRIGVIVVSALACAAFGFALGGLIVGLVGAAAGGVVGHLSWRAFDPDGPSPP